MQEDPRKICAVKFIIQFRFLSSFLSIVLRKNKIHSYFFSSYSDQLRILMKSFGISFYYILRTLAINAHFVISLIFYSLYLFSYTLLNCKFELIKFLIME